MKRCLARFENYVDLEKYRKERDEIKDGINNIKEEILPLASMKYIDSEIEKQN
jgi:hypothetical protein